MTPPDDRPIILNPKNLVPVGVAVAIVGCAISIAMWMEGRFNTLDRNLERVGDRVANVELILTDRVTYPMFEQWTELLQAKNPTLLVPVPRK